MGQLARGDFYVITMDYMDLKALLRIPRSETASQLTKSINLVQLRMFRLQLSQAPLVMFISDPV